MIAAGLALLLAACGDDDTARDASMPDAPDTGVAIAAPMPPAAAELPSFGDCPSGWTPRTTAAGFALCDPFPEGPPACDGAQRVVAGEPSCRAIGTACADPVAPPGMTAVHVRAGATGGDGSSARPYGTVAEATRAAPVGAAILVAAGRYEGTIEVTKRLTIVGACASDTILHDDGLGTIGVFTGAEVTISNVTIAAPIGVAIEIASGTRATIDNVYVDGSVAGVRARGATMTLRKSAVRAAADDPFANVACYDSECTLEDVTLYGGTAPEAALLGAFGGRLDATRLTLLGTGNRSWTNPVVIVDRGAEVALREVAQRGLPSGIHAASGHTVVEDASIVGARAAPALLAVDAAMIEATRVSVEDAGELAIATQYGTLALHDVIVEGVDADDATASGIFSGLGATIAIDRVGIGEVSGLGLAVAGDDSHASGHDLTIRDIRDDGVILGGAALSARGEVALERVAIEGVVGSAVFAARTAAPVSILDLSVRDIAEGFGLATFGAALHVERARIEDAASGVVIATDTPDDGTTATGSDIVVSGRAEGGEGATIGRALEVYQASAELERVTLDQSEQFGVVVVQGTLTLRDARVTGVASCEAERCSGLPAGIGLGAYAATLDVERFDVQEAALCGVHIGEGGEVELRTGAVTGSGVGVCLEVPDYAIDRLMRDVVYERNGANLDAVSLPVPAPGLGTIEE